MKNPDYELLTYGKKFQQCFAKDMTFNNFFMPYSKTMYVSHYHLHYEILYVYENQRLLTVDRKKYKLDKTKIFCLPPNVMHKSEICNDAPLRRLLLNFTHEYIQQYTDLFDIDILGCFHKGSYVLGVPDKYSETICAMLREIETYSDKLDAYSNQMLALSTLKLLTFCSQKLSPCNVTDSIISYLEEHYNNDVTLDALSKKFAMSKYKISRAFEKETGMSYTQSLTRIRVEKAREMLDNPHISITDIATNVGFQTPQYFSKVFKSVTNMTPTEYRKSIK